MADITLIQPKTSRGTLDHPFPPLGILYLGAALRSHGHEVSVLDGDTLTRDEYETQLRQTAGIVGFSATFFHLPEVKRIVPLLSDATVVIGGTGVSSLQDKKAFLLESGADYLLEGEAEESLVQLLAALGDTPALKKVPGIHLLEGETLYSEGSSPRVDVNKHPLPDRSLIDLATYTAEWGNYTGMIATRGCPYTCTFCDLSVAGKKVRYRSIESIAAELIELERRGLDDVFVFDDLFTVNKQYLRSFAEKKRTISSQLTWGGNARADLVDDELCELVAGSCGTRLWMGIESGSQRMLDAYGKRLTPEQIANAFDRCHAHGIEPNGYFIVGHPEEHWDDIMQTAALITRIRPATIDISVLTPLPGTVLYEQTEQHIDAAKLQSIDARRSSVYTNLQIDIEQVKAVLLESYTKSKR